MVLVSPTPGRPAERLATGSSSGPVAVSEIDEIRAIGIGVTGRRVDPVVLADATTLSEQWVAGPIMYCKT